MPHRLADHPLLRTRGAGPAGRGAARGSVEYNRGDLPIGVDGKPAPTGLTIGETIRGIGTSGSWAVLKNIEQHPDYAALLDELLDELRPEIEARTGGC